MFISVCALYSGIRRSILFTKSRVKQELPRPFLVLATLSAAVTLITSLLFVLSDETLDTVRASRRVADMWVESERAAGLQLHRCLDNGGRDCDLVEQRIQRPVAYWNAVLERGKPQSDMRVIRERLKETGTDLEPWRFRLYWFEYVAYFARINPGSGNALKAQPRPGSLPPNLKMLLDLRDRCRAARLRLPADAPEIVALHREVDRILADVEEGKTRYDEWASAASLRLRRILLAVVLASSVLMFVIAMRVSRQILIKWQSREREFRQRDLEQTKSLEQQLAQLQQVLAEKATLLESVERHVRELRATETALRRSNEDLQQFAYVASHDLREPLRNVATHAQLLGHAYRNNELDQLGDLCMGVIIQGAKRMDALITGLLAYSRIARDQAGITNGPTDLRPVVDAALANLATALAPLHAKISYAELPTVLGWNVQLIQLFQNLIENSIKYRQLDRPLEIEIRAVPQDRSWLISVQDNGTGFRPEYAEKVFVMFQRVHSSDIPGTGVGLAICKAIVARHGGEIWAKSSLGEGATIYFTLPCEHEVSEAIPYGQAVHIPHRRQ